jgi:hypothetical protein
MDLRKVRSGGESVAGEHSRVLRYGVRDCDGSVPAFTFLVFDVEPIRLTNRMLRQSLRSDHW